MKIEPIYKVIGKRIKTERERVGMSKRTLAGKIGMTRASILNMEHGGRQRIHIHTIALIAKALGIQQRRLYRDLL